MTYGTSVYDTYWDDLMSRARRMATLSGQKIKITAMLNSPRAAKYCKRNYEYIIQLPEGNEYNPRCGQEGPSGKVCILPKKAHPPYQHLSRSTERDMYVLWHYKSVHTRNPVPYVTSVMSCVDIPVEELEKIGLSHALSKVDK